MSVAHSAEKTQSVHETFYNMRWTSMDSRVLSSVFEKFADPVFSALSVYYQVETDWEQDFLLRDVLPPAPCTLFKASEFEKETPPTDRKNLALVFSSNWLKADAVKQFCDKFKPAIVVHCSDEYGNRPEYEEIADMCALYLRQYSYAHYPTNKHTAVIPLGYASGMFSSASLLYKFKPAVDRTLTWAHVGKMKADRAEMRQAFSQFSNGYFGLADKVVMRELYSNAKFVPVGRGNASINCFRIYEALVCGAIPVVVATKQELKNTFSAEKDYPWLTAETWPAAASKCQKLLQNADALLAAQNRCKLWWHRRIQKLNEKVSAALVT